MVEPITCITIAATTTLLSRAGDAALSGIIGNRLDALFCGTIKQVAGPLWVGFVHKGNHDLQKGLNEVYQKSLMDMADTCHRIGTNEQEKTYAQKLKEFAKKTLQPEGQTAEVLEEHMTTLLGGTLDDGQDRYSLIIDRLITDIIDHYQLLLGPMPEPFQDVFRNGTRECKPWNERFRHHLAQLIKSDGGVRFEKIYSAQTLSRIFDKQMAFGEIAKSLQESIEALHQKVDNVPDATAQAVIAALSAQGYVQRAQDVGIDIDKLQEVVERELGGGIAPKDLVERLEQWIIEIKERLNNKSNFGVDFDDAYQASIKRVTSKTEGLASQPLQDYLIALDEETKAKKQAAYDAIIETEKLDFNFAGAVEWIIKKLEHEQGEMSFDALLAEQDVWYKKGSDLGLNLELEVAILLARECLNRAATPYEKGTAHNNLGNALSILGEREVSTESLNEAVDAYRLALEVLTRDREPLVWAMTQDDLGNALTALEQREGGTMRLNGAVDAYRLALEVLTRDREPLVWAMTQDDLGNALTILGVRKEDSIRLNGAVAAYRLALEERTRDRVPPQWAMTQDDLGNALRTLGLREAGTERLNEAVDANRLALEVLTRQRVPLKWAGTQHNLASVYRDFYNKTQDRSHLQTALNHAEAALEVFEQAGAEYYITNCQNLIDNLKAQLSS